MEVNANEKGGDRSIQEKRGLVVAEDDKMDVPTSRAIILGRYSLVSYERTLSLSPPSYNQFFLQAHLYSRSSFQNPPSCCSFSRGLAERQNYTFAIQVKSKCLSSGSVHSR